MANISIKQFKGSVPRVAPHLLAQHSAAKAVDCKLHSGSISSWNELKKIDDLPPSGKLVLIGCCWHDIPLCAQYTHGDVSCNHVYITGRNSYPEVGVVNNKDCEIDWYRLGVPCPTVEMDVSHNFTDELDKSSDSRVYAYQYVNALGHRGSLSPTTQPILVNDGTPVMLSGWDKPDASWSVVSVRIYRSVSGIDPGNQQTNTFNTEFMFVGEVSIDTPSFIDNKYAYELFEAVDEDLVSPPPAGMQGITAVKSMNILAGYLGNKLFFSHNHKYYDWSIELTLDDNICAIAESNGLLYVMTDGHPYVVSAAADCETAECRKVLRHESAYPMIGCGNDRVATMPEGVVYPTASGLAMLSGNNPPFYITSALYSPEDWQRLLPDTIIPVVFDGYLFVWGKNGSFVIKTPANKNEWDADYHSSLSDIDVVHSFVSRNGVLFIEKEDGVYQWNAAVHKRPHYWKSAKFLTGVPINFGSVLLSTHNGAEHLKIISDGRTIFSREVYKSENVMALPLWGTGSKYEIELSGVADVSAVSVSTSTKEHSF